MGEESLTRKEVVVMAKLLANLIERGPFPVSGELPTILRRRMVPATEGPGENPEGEDIR